MTELPTGVRELDHTADTGIEVEAATLPGLFDLAARALRVLGSSDGSDDAGGRGAAPREAARRTLELSLEADDPGELLVRWLGELLYRADAHGEAYRDADLRIDGDGTSLEAVVTLDRLDAPGIALKSVTYHGLECRPLEDGGWTARVIFDV